MSGSVAIQKRTRKGCLTCRRRRRKCDEARPRCQNCAEKQFECIYGTRVIFRESNLLGLAPKERRDLERRTPSRYSDLRFVGAREDDTDCFERYSPEDDTTSPDREDDDVNVILQSPPRGSQNDFGVNQLHTEDDTGSNDPGPQLMDVVDPSYSIQTPTVTTTQSQETVNANNEDRIDTTQLISLSPSHNLMTLSYLATSISPSFPLQGYGFQGTQGSGRAGQQPINEIISVDNAAGPSISPNKKHHLLKLFIEKASLWLSLSRLTNALGVELSCLARTSSALLYSMLENAACQESIHGTPSGNLHVRRTLRTLALRLLGREVCQSKGVFAAEILLQVSELLTTELKEWNVVFRDFSSLYTQKHMLGQRLLSWILARFDIAASIISSLPTATEIGRNEISQLFPATEVQDAIILCAKIVNLGFSQTTQPSAKKEAWLELQLAVENWQMHLVTEAQPILTINGVKAVESEHLSTSFPVVIYTNRPAFYTSSLYHLSCLLLLKCRPHSLRRAKNTCLKTIPYHAVHLCGVSKSNRLAYSWDPVVITGLLYAGKYLSHCKQQIELLQQLEELAELTGWKMRKEIQSLQEFWKASQ